MACGYSSYPGIPRSLPHTPYLLPYCLIATCRFWAPRTPLLTASVSRDRMPCFYCPKAKEASAGQGWHCEGFHGAPSHAQDTVVAQQPGLQLVARVPSEAEWERSPFTMLEKVAECRDTKALSCSSRLHTAGSTSSHERTPAGSRRQSSAPATPFLLERHRAPADLYASPA